MFSEIQTAWKQAVLCKNAKMTVKGFFVSFQNYRCFDENKY